MKREELIRCLHRLKAETGSLACLGCGHEHGCGIRGCAILREAIRQLERAKGGDINDDQTPASL